MFIDGLHILIIKNSDCYVIKVMLLHIVVNLPKISGCRFNMQFNIQRSAQHNIFLCIQLNTCTCNNHINLNKEVLYLKNNLYLGTALPLKNFKFNKINTVHEYKDKDRH